MNAFVLSDEIAQLRRTLLEQEREINRLARHLNEANAKLSEERRRHYEELEAEKRAHAEKARELEYVRTVADYRGLKLQTRIEGYERRSVPRGVERRK